MTQLTVIILTMDEALHIARAIRSVQSIATQVLVVDSGSTDGTVALAQAQGAQVLQHQWVNHADQFNWALDQIAGQPGWVLRLDADEVLRPALAQEIRQTMNNAGPEVKGAYLGRSMYFQGHPIRHGGLFPVKVLRLFRNGSGHCETRWMDEHIVVEGKTVRLKGQIIDDNRKPLDWWIAKHNDYASREVVDIMNQRHGFMAHETIGKLQGGNPAEIKRWIKENIYARLPIGLRAAGYFFYRFILRLGVLDGPQGRAFHILQGFWYRYLVDAKLAEVQRYAAAHQTSPAHAIHQVLGIPLAGCGPAAEKEAA